MSEHEHDRTLEPGEKIQAAFHNAYGHLETLAEARASMAACPHAAVESGPISHSGPHALPAGYTEHLCRDCGAYWVTDESPETPVDQQLRRAGARQLPGLE